MSDSSSAAWAPTRRSLAVLATALLAAACGGGGDDGDTSSERPAGSAEGFYIGTISGGTPTRFQLLVLENNEFWLVYGTQSASGGSFLIQSFMHGAGTFSAGTLSSATMKDYGTAPVATGTFSASYKFNSSTLATSVAATASTAGRSLALAGTNSTADYLYGLPPSTAALAGSWPVGLSTGETATLAVSSAGALTLSTSRGCAGTGALVPRASGKNVFDLTLTFGAAPCVFPGTTFSGTAISYPLALGGGRQLTATARNSAQTAGLVLVGSR